MIRLQLVEGKKGFIDIAPGTVFPLNFGIADIRDLSKRRGTFSKTITMPGNKNNIKLFGFLHDINVVTLPYGDHQFDINKLTYVDAIQNGVCILPKILFQLTGVTKVRNVNTQEDEITFEGLVKDSISDLFTVINNKKLNELKAFEYLNHIYSAANVTASFNNTVDDGFKYIIPWEGNTPQYALEAFRPAIYIKKYMDAIFASAGYSYSWPTMDDYDVRFSKLLLPFVGDVPTPTDEDSKDLFVNIKRTGITNTLVSTSYINTGVHYTSPIQTLSIPTLVSGSASLYNTGTSTYFTPNVNQTNNFIRYTVDIEWSMKFINPYGIPVYIVGLDATPGGAYPTDAEIADYALRVDPELVITNPQGNAIGVTSINPLGELRFTRGTAMAAGTTTYFDGISEQVTVESTLPINIGDGVQLKALLKVTDVDGPYNFYAFKYNSGSSGTGVPASNAYFQYEIKSMTVKTQTFFGNSYGYNNIIPMNRFVPAEIQQADFLRSILTMFNLYTDVDKNNTKNINLISRDKFYDSGKVEDWTNKLVSEDNQEINFLPEISKKRFLLTYKKDDDVLNKGYISAVNKIYGQLEYTFDNEYVRDTDTKEIIFAPTPMIRTSFGAVVSGIPGILPKIQPRILYDGGVETSSSYRIYNYYVDAGNNNFIDTINYPLTIHWDKKANPTYDLNFGVCDYYLRSDDFGNLTNNNLFNMHWRRTLNQINNGKLLTAYFWLNEADIRKMKMNDTILVDNAYYNINLIQDYDANSKSPTRVELISIDNDQSIKFVNSGHMTLSATDTRLDSIRELTYLVNQQNNTIISNSSAIINGQFNYVGPTVKYSYISGTRNITFGDSTITGNNNTNYADNNTINGSNNTVYGPNNNIIGSGNTVPEGVNGITIIGSGIVASQSDTLYTNNIILASGSTINGVTISIIENLANQTLDTLRQQDNVLTGELIIATAYPGFGQGTFSLNQTGFTMSNNTAYNYNTPFISTIGYQASDDKTIRTAGYYRIYNEFYNSETTLYNNALTWNDMDNVVTKQLFFTGSNTANYYMPDKTFGNYVLATIDDITGGSGTTGATGATGPQGDIGPTGATGFGFTASGLEKLTEGANTGWRLIGRLPARYGDIGSEAIDFSFSSGNSSTRGARGTYSIAVGRNTRAAESYAIAMGNNSNADGIGSIAMGLSNNATGDASIAMGEGSNASGYVSVALGASTAIGNYSISTGQAYAEGAYSAAFGNGAAFTYGECVVGPNPEFLSGNATAFDPIDFSFRVGVGNGVSKDGFRVYKNGALFIGTSSQTDVTNQTKGMIILNNATTRLNFYTGTTWSSIAYLSDIPTVIAPSGLESLNEGNGIGWRLIGRDSLNYGNIGLNAVDFSNSQFPSSTSGATGTQSFAVGQNSTAAGVHSVAIGQIARANGQNSVALGVDNLVNGTTSVSIGGSNIINSEQSFIFGFNNNVNTLSNNSVLIGTLNTSAVQYGVALGRSLTPKSLGEVVVGYGCSPLTTGSASVYVAIDPLFRIGGFKYSAVADDFLTVYKNGMLRLMSVTQSSVSNGTTGSVISEVVSGRLKTWNSGTWSAIMLEPVIDTTTTALSKATLNTNYPNVPTGFKVHAKDIIIGGGLIYEKTGGTDWLSYPIAMVT